MPDMRFAPPPALRIHTQTGGLNSMSVRSANERLILSLLVQHGAMSRMELGKHSGLSAQTISVIVRALQRDGLIIAGEAQRGRVGPPTIPVALNPEGAFGLGVSLQPHGIDTVLIGLTGTVAYRMHQSVAADDDPLIALESAVSNALGRLDAAQSERLAGLGLALPTDPGAWTEALDDGELLETRLSGETGLPVYIQNGVTAAAGAESVFGAARDVSDYVFVHVGALTEFRLVLQNRVHAGATPSNRAPSLGDLASFAGGIRAAGTLEWSDEVDDATASWIDRGAREISARVEELSTFVQVKDLLVAGLPPAGIRNRLVAQLQALLPQITVASGHVADDSTAVGAATLALTGRYLLRE
ncbi:ROK family transcriptional regulator [Psychromarinibacter sp. C21-152]|uniref:ROK family transcriptional regulator n=1 Tax=Psychromarinibacter sediminicola TaxID=3033385 RepID=A0AAE3NZU7_9RHOB|nr:ROK family transcriptional regulator [Psychromarinibacter sediminicola]MDF0603752.1 ROK family transcriptional regulator [Psychromarinibacter sediminicola]